MAIIKTETYLDVAYKGRLFGDVLREIVYCVSENTYDFIKVAGITSVSLSNFMNNNRYPGVVTLRKIAEFLPENERNEFVSYYLDPETKRKSADILKERGVLNPYPVYGPRNTEKEIDEFYKETNRYRLEKLHLPGLFKYLSADEKKIFKDKIVSYILTRNLAMQEAMKEEDSDNGCQQAAGKTQ